jgi:hypothetical protein
MPFIPNRSDRGSTSSSTMPGWLRPPREKIFGAAPSRQLDGNAKARVWAAATAYNAHNRKPGKPRVR